MSEGAGDGRHGRHGRHARWGRWWTTAAVLLVAGIALIGVGVRGQAVALPPPASQSSSGVWLSGQSPFAATSLATPDTPPTVTPLSTARSVPVSLSVPAIGLTVSLSTLGLNPDGSVQVPTTIAQPGWFRLGPTPGQIGSAVILGHVDNSSGPGVFFYLRTLVAGDRVLVDLADGDVAQFAVDSVLQYPKQQFPAQRVYASHGSSTLQLVTCGGVFDHQTGSYLSNVVVYTSLVGVAPKSPRP